ncbi:hypothetical protein NE237_027734 [Protea cynaroides]|uniref:Glucose-methanol-choline oxidoreductase N-terminal domain-containing protein n=1 Tax=Protea cynaroides TaxID=273540 RepID=A0A9Q0GN19_9MAGN|nr:hypothetical protein NE237_027734 [Protea cynaroides]
MDSEKWWRVISAALLAGILCFHCLCHAQKAPNYTFVQQAISAPAVSYYDYIIVGGGTSGCPLAATLSQNASVLLLERGGSPYGNQNITNYESFSDTLADTSPTSAAQHFISEDGVYNVRARVLGGGSCVNAGFYTRASPDYVSAAGWDSRLVNQSYRWVEKMVAFKPHLLPWQSAVRDGLLEAGVLPYNNFTYDHIFGTKVGGTIFDLDGHRHTAADLLQYGNPKGLTVFLHATVQRIFFRTEGKLRPRAHGVVFRDEAGVKHKVYLKKGSMNEIILSAGALGSPQLLMLSGVGPAHQLRSHKIKVMLDQPLVGQGMADNPMNTIFVPSPIPVEISLVQVVGITRLGTYIETVSGINLVSQSSTTPQRNFGMFSPQTGQLSVISSKQRTPEAMKALRDEGFRGGFIVEKVIGPRSTGHLELRNRNPDDNPCVTFNYFKELEDLKRCVDGIKIIKKVIQSNAFSKFRYPYLSVQTLINITSNLPMNLLPKHVNSSTSLQQFCKDTVMTIWHYHGGCQVGRVVDPNYKVLGLDGLRVIDGSTFLESPGTNPQATLMMLGRCMGVRILKEKLAKKNPVFNFKKNKMKAKCNHVLVLY